MLHPQPADVTRIQLFAINLFSINFYAIHCFIIHFAGAAAALNLSLPLSAAQSATALYCRQG
jgi:hypothetical protein